MLKGFRDLYLSSETDDKARKEINYAINKINDRKIYTSATHDHGSRANILEQFSKKKQKSDIQWLSEYSDISRENSDS